MLDERSQMRNRYIQSGDEAISYSARKYIRTERKTHAYQTRNKNIKNKNWMRKFYTCS